MRTGPRGQDLTRQERIESDYWRRSSASTGDLHSIASLTNTINKFTDAGVFLTSLLPFRDIFAGASSILEIGAGQGWASCIVKRLFPHARVATTDISPWALKAMPTWEHLFQARVDGVSSPAGATRCRSRTAPCTACSAFRRRIISARIAPRSQEIHRVLAPGGHALLFLRASCPRLWHRAAAWRVNRKRPDVPEDVLVRSSIRDLAGSGGASMRDRIRATALQARPGRDALLRAVAVRPSPAAPAAVHRDLSLLQAIARRWPIGRDNPPQQPVAAMTDAKRRTWWQVLVAAVIIVAMCGLALVGGAAFLFYRHIRTEVVSSDAADSRMADVRAKFGGQQAWLRIGSDGSAEIAGRPDTGGAHGPLISLRVLAYNPAEGRLADVNVPFWLLRLAPDGQLRIDDGFFRLRIGIPISTTHAMTGAMGRVVRIARGN